MQLTLREIHWRIKKITARLNQRMRFDAALAGAELPGGNMDDNPNGSELPDMSPEMEARMSEELMHTQERLKKRFQK